MKKFEILTSILLCAILACMITTTVFTGISMTDKVIDTPANTGSNEEYVTYFDLAYAALTNPSSFLGKQITLVGYYTNSTVQSDNSSSNSDSTDNTDQTSIYHFITTYGQLDECHLTVEFTTKDNEYPEIGTLIKITGLFTAYTENNNTYYTITADTYTTVE